MIHGNSNTMIHNNSHGKEVAREPLNFFIWSSNIYSMEHVLLTELSLTIIYDQINYSPT